MTIQIVINWCSQFDIIQWIIFELLISIHHILKIKGVPEQPMCGFSNAVVQIFRMHGVQYDAHNVLADESIRQGNNQPYSSLLLLATKHPIFVKA